MKRKASALTLIATVPLTTHSLTDRLMATLGRSTPSANTRDLPDPLAEKRELRRMIRELEAENERLRRACKEAMGMMADESVSGSVATEDVAPMIETLRSALDGGGESDD